MEFLTCSPGWVTLYNLCPGTHAHLGIVSHLKLNVEVCLFPLGCEMSLGLPRTWPRGVKTGLLEMELGCNSRTCWRNNCQPAAPKACGGQDRWWLPGTLTWARSPHLHQDRTLHSLTCNNAHLQAQVWGSGLGT